MFSSLLNDKPTAMPMNNFHAVSARTKTALIATAGVLLLAAFMWWRGEKSNNVASSHAEIAESGSALERADSTGARKKYAHGDISLSSSAQFDARSLLNSSDKHRWIEAHRQFLSKMTPSAIWNVLMAPGIADQVQSKSIRLHYLQPCLSILGRDEVSSITKKSAQLDACADLAKASSLHALRAEYSKLNSDVELQTADHRIPIPDPKKLDQAHLEQEWNLARTQFSQIDDPYLAGMAVRHMWWTHSPDISADWSEILALSSAQQDQLMQVVARDVSCQMAGGCSSYSPWTISFCTTQPGAICPPGSTFDEIVALNLSQVQLALRQRILDNLSQLKGVSP